MSVHLYQPPLNFTAKPNWNSRANKHCFKTVFLFFFVLCTAGCTLSRVNEFLQHKIQTTNEEMRVMQDFKIGFKTAAFLIWQPYFGFLHCVVCCCSHLSSETLKRTKQSTECKNVSHLNNHHENPKILSAAFLFNTSTSIYTYNTSYSSSVEYHQRKHLMTKTNHRGHTIHWYHLQTGGCTCSLRSEVEVEAVTNVKSVWVSHHVTLCANIVEEPLSRVWTWRHLVLLKRGYNTHYTVHTTDHTNIIQAKF
jgi:hypothetical protein